MITLFIFLAALFNALGFDLSLNLTLSFLIAGSAGAVIFRREICGFLAYVIRHVRKAARRRTVIRRGSSYRI